MDKSEIEKKKIIKIIEKTNTSVQLLLWNDRKKLVHKYKRNLPIRLLGQAIRFCRNPLKYYRIRRDTLEVRKSGLFDDNWYLHQNTDLYLTTVDLLQHFMLYGYKEGRNPHPLFDIQYYLTSYSDIETAQTNPLLHFIRYGWKEGRNPNSFFSVNYYLGSNPDVKQTGINPLFHFSEYGWKEGRNPSPLFETNFYIESNPDVKDNNVNPLTHFLLFGIREGRKPRHSIEENYPEKSILPTDSQNGLDNFFNYNILEEDKKIIEQSNYFDRKYYLTKNPDILQAGIDPIIHFCNHGWREGRNPNPNFNISFYLDTYEDIKVKNINPLVHYIKYGQAEKRLTKAIEIDEEILVSKADISDIELISPDWGSSKIAIVAHIFYTDLIDEFLQYFKNIPLPYDLYITTTVGNKEHIKKRIKKEGNILKVNIQCYKNRGRDIGPFVELLKSKLVKYDLVCKIHSKKSTHQPNLSNWRRYLIDNLLGSDKIIEKIIDEFNHDEKLGIIYPVHHPYISYIMEDLQEEKNMDIAKQFFPEIKFDFNCLFDFPSGSMFWFRPKALSLLHTSNISIDSFENEKGEIDGTLAHTIERLFGILPIKSGYHLKKAFFPEKIRRLSNKPMVSINETESILFVSHDLALAGAEMLLLHLMRWFLKHTPFKINLLAIKKGIDDGKLLNNFNKITNVLIWDELLDKYTENEAIDYLKKQTGKVDLIYGNTIIAPSIYKYLRNYNAPYITHIHELEQTIKKYVASNVLDDMKKYTNTYIPCSEPVKNNLFINHQIPEEKLKLVNAFIQPSNFVEQDRSSLRKQLSLPESKTIIWGCGTIYWRKGVDIFIQTAKKIKDIGIKNFEFIWIGANYWKSDSEEYGTWNEWESYINENKLQSHITFLGEIDNPKRYFLAGDIFYLPSREDPCPLVCLEAAECNLPIICFEQAGGMPSFVETNAGSVVPFLDINSAANEIISLINNKSIRRKKGETAHEKFIKRHSSEIAIPEILKICHSTMRSQPLVSVIIPVYNQEKYIASRIESVINQTFRDYEIIILDDCSTDKSLEIIQQYDYHPSITIFQNEVNSGSVFRQWQKGVKMANGKYIWIAEGDDLAEPIFLETLLPLLNHDKVNLSYCASHTINENDDVEKEHYLNAGHYSDLNYPKSRWLDSYTSEGIDEIVNALSIRNTIPNVSAVLFRATSVKMVDFNECSSFVCGGDWFAYVSILKNGKISYSSKHLNYHRIHNQSVVGKSKLTPKNILPDYFKMHSYILENFTVQRKTFELMINSVIFGLKSLWPNLNDQEFQSLYNTNYLQNKFENKN